MRMRTFRHVPMFLAAIVVGSLVIHSASLLGTLPPPIKEPIGDTDSPLAIVRANMRRVIRIRETWVDELLASPASQVQPTSDEPFPASSIDSVNNPDFWTCWATADVDRNGVVDLDDLLRVLEAFRLEPEFCPIENWCGHGPGIDESCPEDICNCRSDAQHVIDLDDILAVLVAITDGFSGERPDLCNHFRDNLESYMRWQRWTLSGWVTMTLNEDGGYSAEVGEQMQMEYVIEPTNK